MVLQKSQTQLGGSDSKEFWETWVQFLGWEDSLEKEMVDHSSILSWRIFMDRGDWLAIFHVVTGSDMTEQLSTYIYIIYTCV